VQDDEIAMRMDGDLQHEVRFNIKHFPSFDHGFPITIHKSQGAIVDQAYILASRSIDTYLAYVAMTRHREDMQLFINQRDKRAERAALLKMQAQWRLADLQARRNRMPTGLRGLLARATGQYDCLLQSFEEETRAAQKQDRAAQQALIAKHLKEHKSLSQDLTWQRALSLSLKAKKEEASTTLILPDEALPFSKAELLKSPEKLLAYLSDKNATFNRTNVLRLLAKRIDDPVVLKDIADRAIAHAVRTIHS
jgi:hypothetical protein